MEALYHAHSTGFDMKGKVKSVIPLSDLEIIPSKNEKMKTYNWWGEVNAPPPHLKTQKQLAKMGFKPHKAVGRIETRKYDLYLYDPSDPASAKPKRIPSAKQLIALAAARQKARKIKAYKDWWKDGGFI